MYGGNKFNYITPQCSLNGVADFIANKARRIRRKLEVVLMEITKKAIKGLSHIKVEVVPNICNNTGVPTLYPELRVIHVDSNTGNKRIVFSIPLLPRFLEGDIITISSVNLEDMYDAWLSSLPRPALPKEDKDPGDKTSFGC